MRRRRKPGVSVEIWMIAIFVVALKIPVFGSLWLVWWASKAPEPEVTDADGGGEPRRLRPPGPQPRGPRRRDPHGGLAVPPSPRRVRTRATSGRASAKVHTADD